MVYFSTSQNDISSDQLDGFFNGWAQQPSPIVHRQLLKKSNAFICALDEDTNNVIAFVTITSDDVLSAHIPFLEVLPTHQGRGIGSELMRRALARLTHLYAVDLVCDQELIPFYSRFGMEPRTAMTLRQHTMQRIL